MVVRRHSSVSLQVTTIRQVLLSSRSSIVSLHVWYSTTTWATVSSFLPTLHWHIPTTTRTIPDFLVLHRSWLLTWVSIVRILMAATQVSIISWTLLLQQEKALIPVTTHLMRWQRFATLATLLLLLTWHGRKTRHIVSHLTSYWSMSFSVLIQISRVWLSQVE